MSIKNFWTAAFLAFIVCGCSPSVQNESDELAPAISWLYLSDEQGDTTLELKTEIAYTPEKMEKGMMGRTGFGLIDAMAFNFEQQRVLSFWMKNTLIPMDILFFDANGDFVSSASMAPCKEDPCPIYTSAEPASIALEVPADFVEKNSIGKGWKVSNQK